MDMSGEQFGVPREHRFLPWQEYRKRYVVRSRCWVGRAAWTLDTGGRRELCQKVDKRDPGKLWSTTKYAVETACTKWDMDKDGIGEWWSEIQEMEPMRYRQKALSLRSAVWRSLSSQFKPQNDGQESS